MRIRTSLESAGNIDGDAFDDLLVSIGGESPEVRVFRGRSDWTQPEVWTKVQSLVAGPSRQVDAK